MTWNIPTVVTPVEKRLRIETTLRYGWRAFCGASLLLVLIGLYNVVIPRLYAKFQPLRTRSKVRGAFTWTSTHWILTTMILITIGISHVTFTELHKDMVYLAKRMGRIAVALMPAMYFLALRPTPFLNTFYLELLPLHKWLSRIVVLLSIGHGIAYTYVYTVQHKLFKLMMQSNVFGIIALFGFILIGITSLRAVRRRFYRIFYGVHIITAWLCIILITYHAKPGCTDYMMVCGIIVAWQILSRLWMSDTVKMPVQYVSSSLLLINIPKKKLSSQFQKFAPGSHVRVSGQLYKPNAWLEASHPYTIASLDHEEYLQLVIRKSNYPIKLRQNYSMMGPFRSLSDQFLYASRNGQIKRALFVIGGSGIAFAAPVMRYFQALGIEVKLLWAIRDPNDARILKPLHLHDAAVNGDIEIYFTKKVKKTAKGYETLPQDDLEDEESAPAHNKETNVTSRTSGYFWDNEEDLELGVNDVCCMEEENEPLLSHRLSRNSLRYARLMDAFMSHDVFQEYAANMYNNRPVLNLRIKSWLSGLTTGDNDCCCVDQLLNVKEADKVGAWLISAGSHKLVSHAARWANDNGFTFFQEEYTL